MTSPRTALVTGANRGLGYTVAAQLHALGHRVILTGRDGAAARDAAGSLGAPARWLALDVTDPASVAAARAAAGDVDILVNNAGVLLDRDDPPSSVDVALVARSIEANALGAWRVTQAFLPGMVERGWGRVVMVSSGAGTFSNGLFPGAPAYSTSKVALNAATLLLARELEGSGVLVNAANPGLVRTRMRPDAERTVEEGAAGIVAAATLPDDGPHGCFLRAGGQVAGW